MSLSRQLILLVFNLVLLLFLGTVTISVYNTRDYLESQLGSHAQDAATSLGLSATTHVREKDRAMVVSMVNAMFHRGDYLSIRFQNLQGEDWIERRAEIQIDDVPGWFLGLFELDPPERSATLMSGWQQVGRVLVTSHPGLAYRQLWQTALHTLNLFLIGSLLILLVALVVLRYVLRPLKQVEWQAEAICNREFPVVEQRPFTLEFRRVVEAMNRLSSRVGRMLSESEQMAARLREQVFRDPLTGLANRRQFMDVLEHRIADAELFESGGLLLVQLKDFKRFNQEQGYTAGDELLKAVGTTLAETAGEQTGATVAHLSGADFAILLEAVSGEQMTRFAADVAAAVAGLYRRFELASSDVGHVGGALYRGQESSELLSEADLALREAQRAGANASVVHQQESATASTRTGSEWRALIENAITEGYFSLLRQPVVGCVDCDLLHQEVYLRIRESQDGPDIPASMFIPMAESCGLSSMIDKAVIEEVLVGIEAGAYPGKVAINLSADSLGEKGHLDWVEARLRQRPLAAKRLILELPEYGVSAQISRLTTWIDRLQSLGVEFSLDQFGKGFSSFAYLRSVKAHFVKVDGSFVRNLEQQEDNQFFLRTLASIAHGLDMQVIGESVETEAAWQTLRRLGLDGGRGYWLGAPE